jgi:hypothetical protein
LTTARTAATETPENSVERCIASVVDQVNEPPKKMFRSVLEIEKDVCERHTSAIRALSMTLVPITVGDQGLSGAAWLSDRADLPASSPPVSHKFGDPRTTSQSYFGSPYDF